MSSRRLTPRERVEYRAARGLSLLSPRAQVRLSGKPPVVVDGQQLEPEVQMTLALLEKRGDPPVETVPPAVGREVTRRQAIVFSGPTLPVGGVRDLHVPGPAGPLPARHYRPLPEAGVLAAPLLVFLHGGGFVIGDLETHDAACRMLCRTAGVHVLAIDYRLAPEHPFPAAVDDSIAALRWALANAGELGADPSRVAVGGDSAGANLSAVACQALRDEGGAQPVLQLLFYPPTDATSDLPSARLFAEGFFLTGAMIEWFTEQYGGPHPDPADPRVSPGLAEDLSGLPRAIVVTAAFDPLRDQGERYAEQLREAGVPVLLRRVPGNIHGFLNMTGTSRVSRDSVVEVAGALRALLALT